MPLFQTDVKLYATAYIVAATIEEAHAMAKDLALSDIEVADGYVGADLAVYGGAFHTGMPSVSLSPAMTIARLGDQDFSLYVAVEDLYDGRTADD